MIYARRRIIIQALQYNGSNHFDILDMIENIDVDFQCHSKLNNGDYAVIKGNLRPKLFNYLPYEESGVGIDPDDGKFKLNDGTTEYEIPIGTWVIKNEPGNPKLIELLNDKVFNARYFKWSGKIIET